MEISKYQESLNKIKAIHKKPSKNLGKAIQDLQHLIDICSKPQLIDLSYVMDMLDCLYEVDDKGKLYKSEWNNDVSEAIQIVYDARQSYSWRLLDTKVLNEIKELVGNQNDVGLKNRIKELLEKEQELQGYKEREQYEYEQWQDRT